MEERPIIHLELKVHHSLEAEKSSVLEDVTTTGGSSIKAVQMIHQATDCEVVAVISIVDREEGAVDAFATAGIHFESIMTRSDVAGQ